MDTEALNHLRIIAIGIQIQNDASTRLWTKSEITKYLEGHSHGMSDKITLRLMAQLSPRYIEPEVTHNFITSPLVVQSWPRHLWAQRTGMINISGIYPQIKDSNECPLCHQPLTYGIIWHGISYLHVKSPHCSISIRDGAHNQHMNGEH